MDISQAAFNNKIIPILIASKNAQANKIGQWLESEASKRNPLIRKMVLQRLKEQALTIIEQDSLSGGQLDGANLAYLEPEDWARIFSFLGPIFKLLLKLIGL